MFQPGSLALIIHSNHPSNIGKVVTLERMSTEKVIEIPHDSYVIEVLNPDQEPYWLVTGEGLLVGLQLKAQPITVSISVFPQAWLLPLQPDAKTLQEFQADELTLSPTE